MGEVDGWCVMLSADSDPTRIAANIVSGVGFLGAGAIMRGTGDVASGRPL
jgi:putative Mg2+ transporter-C (MgtC) family protein